MEFFGFMRAGEFTLKASQDLDPSSCLTTQDVAVDRHAEPSMLRIHRKQSKTDPFRHGVDIYVGCTGSALCPVAAILAYLAIRLETADGPGLVRGWWGMDLEAEMAGGAA